MTPQLRNGMCPLLAQTFHQHTLVVMLFTELTVLSSTLVCYLPAVLKIEICHFKKIKKMLSILSWKQDTSSFLICTSDLSYCSQGH